MAGFLRKNCCDGIYSSSVDVRFTKLCDNRCSFCIEDMQGIASLGKTNVDRMVASMKTNIELEGKDTVLILGGEPFLLLDELCLFIKQIRADVKHIYITTSIPKQLDLDDKRVRFIMDQIDGLNVSVHHWSWITNNQILKARSNHNRFKLLQELAWFYGGKIRLQCNLVKGGIETVEDVHKLIKLANKLGVAEVKLNELQDVGEDLYVSFDALFPELNLGNPYSTGCVTNITDHFEEAYFELTVKRACFMVNEHSYHGANWLDLIKVIAKKLLPKKFTRANVLYENGLRSSGWIGKDVLIHKEKA